MKIPHPYDDDDGGVQWNSHQGSVVCLLALSISEFVNAF